MSKYLITERGRRDLQEVSGQLDKKTEQLYDILDELQALESQLNTYIPKDFRGGDDMVLEKMKKNKGAIVAIGKDIQKWAKKI